MTLKIIFAGSSKFSLNQINFLFKKTDFKILAILTSKDNKNFIRNKIVLNPIKIFSIKNNILLFQPEKITYDFIENIKNLNPDIIISSSYGLYFPKYILDIPKLGCINIHASLLPLLKGPAPIHWSLINGDKYTGITIIKINEKFDDGKILSQFKYKIKKNYTYDILLNKLSNLGNYALLNTLNFLTNKENKIKLINNNNNNFYARKINKIDAKINFNESANLICRKIKAFNTWPICFFYIENIKIQILLAISRFNFIKFKFNERKKILIYNKKIFITTKKGILNLIKIKIPNGKIIDNCNIINLKIFKNKYLIN